MLLRYALVALTVVSLALALPGTPAGAQAIQVFVDGQVVTFDQPPMTVGGRLLVPLRGVFERLGATVQWDAATSTAIAQRGDTQVQLTVGSRVAYVGGRAVPLDVPALIVGGRVLVPLRFVSEAMGARVDWHDASRSVLITSAPAAQPMPPAPVPPPAPPPPAPPAVSPPPGVTTAMVEGTVLRVDLGATPQRLLVERDARIYTFAVTPDTTITVVDVATNRVFAVTLEQVRGGAQVRVTADAAGRAILIRLLVREITGRLDATTSRMIALSTGQTFSFADDVRILIEGREASREQLRPGMEVTLRVNPQTGLVLEVSASRVGPPPLATPMPGITPRIQSFTHDARAPLREGQTLSVTLQGTPGGQVTFDIFGVASGLAMRETSPGTYQGTYVVRAGDSANNAAIFARLRLGAQEGPLVQAGIPVTIDTTPPIIVQRFPEPNATVSNVRPNILVQFSDQGGTGVNPASVLLFVNALDVTAGATITETAIAFSPGATLSGTVTVRLHLADRAGNTTEDRFSFRVTVAPASFIRSVTVQPTVPLRAGEVLMVTVTGEPGASADFRIEGVTDWRPMVPAANQPGTYLGQYTIRPGDDAHDARVLVRLRRGDAVSRAEATARLTIVAADIVARPAILAPAPGTRVRAPITIRGTTTPGYRVTVKVDYKSTVLVFQVQGTLAEAETTADASGNWAVTLRQNAPVSDAEITITVIAVDPLNRRSPATVVTVRQG